MQDKITRDQLAKRIKSKYPQYNDMDNDLLVDKILQKYPVYKDQLITEDEQEVDEVKKKEDSTVSQEKDLDFTSVQDSSDIKKKVSEEDYDKGYFEFDDRFSAGANEVMASISRIPVFIAEQVATAYSYFDDDFREQLNSMSREERDLALSGAVDAVPKIIGGQNLSVMDSTKASEEYTKEAEKIRSSFDTFDTSITEDIAAGDLGQAAGRLFNEAAGAVPSMIQAMIPYVGIASIGIGSAAQKSKELQDKGEDLNWRTSTNSIVSGTAEGLADLVTKKIGGRLFNSITGKGKDYTIKTLKSFAKDFGIDFAEEGASETGSLLVSKLADYAISGDEEAFTNTLYEFTDTFLVGGFATGPLSSGKIGIDITRQNIRRKNINNKIKDSKYKSLSDAFSKNNMDEIDSDQIDVAKSKGSKEALEFDLAEKVRNKIITKEDADARIKAFEEVSELAKKTEGLELTKEKEKTAIELLREKTRLEKTIEGKDENLVAPQRKRIEEINDQLSKVQEETVEETEQPETTEEVVAEELVKPDLEPKLTYQTSNQTQVTVDESGKFQEAVDVKTGKKRSKTATRKAQNELIEQRDYTTGKSAFDDVPAGQSISDPSQLVADKSENAQEIAQEYQRKKEEQGILDPVVEAFVGKYKVLRKGLERYYGSKDDLTGIQGYLRGRKGVKGMPLDKIAIEVSDAVGREVDPAELFDIMMDPQYKSNTTTKEANIVTELRNRFIEITGFDGTDAQIDAIAKQDPSKLKPVKEPIEITEEQAEAKKELEIEEKVEQADRVAQEERQKSKEPVKEGISNRIIKGFDSAFKFLKKQAKIHFSAQGLQPDIIYKERESRDANIRKFKNRIDRTRKDLQRALKNISKEKIDDVMKEFDQVFRGDLKAGESTLPLELLSVAGRMRAEIDGLSNMLMESGYFDKSEGIEAIQKNLGSYVNRSYRLFSDKNWANKVSEEVKENARKFFRRQAIEQGRVVSEQEIEQQINEILNKAEDNKFIVRGKDGRIDKDILKRRKDIPAELRALMGEVTNPLENYQNTVAKQAMLLFNYKFQRKIAEAGSNTFFTTSPTKENTVQIAKEGNEAYKELAGLWTTPEIAKTFEMPNPINSHWDAFVKFSSAIKWGKTVGSIATHIKNILGNHGFVLMNGHLDWKEFSRAADLVINEFYGKSTEEQRAYLDELISLGIVKQSATLGDITTMYSDKSFEEAYSRTILDQTRSVANKKQSLADVFRASKAGKKTKSVVDALNDMYQSEDDFFKVVAYGIEKQRYAKALFGKDQSKLTETEKNKVNEIVSEIVKNTYPTYDRVPPIIKRLGRSPFLGAFVSFRAESIRTAIKTFALASRELKSSNPEIKRIGAKRMASASLYTGFKTALATQLGLAATSFVFGGDDDQSEEYNDLRRFLPSWSQDSLIGIVFKKPGSYTYIDLTANDPHAFLSELIISGRKEEDLGPTLISKLESVLSPFLGKDLAFSFVTESYKIYEDERLTSDEKTDKIFTEFYKLLEPGSVTSMRRLSDAAQKSTMRGLGELSGFTGYKPIDMDVQKSYFFRTLDYKKQKSSLTGRYNRVRYNEDSSQEDIKEAYEEVNKDYAEMIKEASEMTQSAIRLGVDSSEISKILKNNGFSKRDIDYIFSGGDGYVFIPSKMRK